MDIAASNRVAGSLCVTGGGILSKWGNRSHSYWTTVYRTMNQRNTLDDQTGMRYVHLTVKKHPWKFRWMSSNWFWASHGINESGKFVGNAKCYRSSVVATGPIKWIHGPPSQCELMNGPNNSYAYKERCYYWRQNCNMTEPGPLVVFSKKDMDSLVAPYKAPPLEWNKSKAADSLFWDLCVCFRYSGVKQYANLCGIVSRFVWNCILCDGTILIMGVLLECNPCRKSSASPKA